MKDELIIEGEESLIEGLSIEEIKLIVKRGISRDEKDWKKADEIRNKIGKLGFELEDKGDLVIVRRRKTKISSGIK